MCHASFYINEIGDTSLPLERPEMLDDDLLKQLHHVLLEVSQYTLFPFSSRTTPFVDPCRRRVDDVSKLRSRLSHFERDPKYGPPSHFSLPSLPVLTFFMTPLYPFIVIGRA